MSRPAPAKRRATAPGPAPAVPGLVQQKSDFTAEGSPPPGRVAGAVPATRSAPADKPRKPHKEDRG